YGFIGATNVQPTGKLINSVFGSTYKFIRYYFKAKKAMSVSDLEFIICRTQITGLPKGTNGSIPFTETKIDGYTSGSTVIIYYDFIETNFPDNPPIYYTVSFNLDGGSGVGLTDQKVLSGTKAVKPTDPNKTKFVFGGWYSDSAKTMTYTFNEIVTSNITLYAKWNDPTTGPYTVTFDTRGGGSVPSQEVPVGGKATKPAPNPTKTNDPFVNWYTNTAFTAVYDFSTVVTGNITLYAKWNSDGAGTGPITTVPGTSKDVDFSTLDYKNYIEVSGAWAKLDSGDKRSLTVDNATITVPDNFCVGLDDIKAEDILKIYLGGDWAKEAYRVYITKNDVDYAWFNPGYFITLVIDSALGDASNADCLVAYDSTDSDKIVTFSRYLLSTKKITVRIMKTADLGLKTNPVSFTDTAGLWMDEAVRFMAARDIVRGVGNNRFDFRSNMSIRDYVLMSMRMFGYKVDDVAGAANYYQVAWDQAKNLGLLANIDNPNSDPITRQQMFLITARLLNKFNFIPDKVEGNSLAKFTDGDKVADYAKDLINSLVAKNLVRGDANNPTLRLPDKSTRAEAAQFLYNIFKDIM
ncbi:MAG: InlB B-repeat-containing protein, partial [Clostridiales bacterium]|nr:InlB B-repeat-containing protein [Clostridiales bacterium]